MPGPPQDGWNQAGSTVGAPESGRPDSPRHNELPARGSRADLRLRLERLPAGHPSSPYNDDGTRKLPEPRLRDLELPLPGHDSENWPGMASRDGKAAAVAGRNGGAIAAPGRGQELSAAEQTSELPRVTAGRNGDPSAAEQTSELPRAATGRNGDPSAAKRRAADRSAPAADEAHLAPDGSWAGKGLYLTPELARIAERALSRCRAAEGRNVFGSYGETGLTPGMRRIEAGLEHGRLVPETEQLALKPGDRFREKLARLVNDEPGADPEQMAASIHDGIRYAYVFDEPNYVRGVLQTRSALEDNGNELITLRNTWDSELAKGISGRWRQRGSGQLFEVQFHTDASWAAKERTQQAYEEITAPETPAAERQQLRAFQREVYASVPVPPHAPMVANYRKGS
jgi:hypothetical protein